LKPSGDSVQPFMDKAAIITYGHEERWKLKTGKFMFTPPNRKYITPGNWLFAWSSTYREIIPLEMSVFGFMKNADPKEVEALMGQIKQLDDRMEAIIEHPEQFEQLTSLAPAQKAKAIEEIKTQIEAKKKELYDAFEKQQKTYEMALKPRVDTGIMNSMFAEGEKTIRQHKINDNLMIYAGLILTLIIVVVSLMLSAAQGMSYADGQKEVGKGLQANSAAIGMLVQQMNGSTGGYIIPVKK
jgi:ribosomal protein L16 Arg81 hydroxylase